MFPTPTEPGKPKKTPEQNGTAANSPTARATPKNPQPTPRAALYEDRTSGRVSRGIEAIHALWSLNLSENRAFALGLNKSGSMDISGGWPSTCWASGRNRSLSPSPGASPSQSSSSLPPMPSAWVGCLSHRHPSRTKTRCASRPPMRCSTCCYSLGLPKPGRLLCGCRPGCLEARQVAARPGARVRRFMDAEVEAAASGAWALSCRPRVQARASRKTGSARRGIAPAICRKRVSIYAAGRAKALGAERRAGKPCG